MYLEPVPGSGERIAIMVALQDRDGLAVRRIVTPDAIEALFGDRTAFVEQQLQHLVNFYSEHKPEGLALLPDLLSGTTWGNPIQAKSIKGRTGIFRQAVARFSAFGSVDEDLPETAAQKQERHGVYFAKRIREAVLKKDESLEEYFNVPLRIVPQGQPVKFHFVKKTTVANFEVLRPTNRANSVNAAQGRLWALAKAMKAGYAKQTMLILGQPPEDSVELSEQAAKELRIWTQELTEEGSGEGVTVKPAYSIEAARDALLDLARAA